MIYLDHGATSFPKPQAVSNAMAQALKTCANPGRGGHKPAMEAARQVLNCRKTAATFFGCQPEQVVFTGNCTQGLNTAIFSLLKPSGRAVISGFEHNAVTRPLHALGAKITVAGRKLFDWQDTLEAFEKALRQGQDLAVFTMASNVFGYVLPIEELSALCRTYGIPFVVDAAQGAGILPINMERLRADFVAMPGHKGLLGPQGTGILLCKDPPKPLLYGGTGSMSREQAMPDFLPDVAEAGTVNVPGIAGLQAGIQTVRARGLENILAKESRQARLCARELEKMGYRVFRGEHQLGTVSFVPNGDCEELAEYLACKGICVRAGLHCAPFAHESAGTLDTGTVRISFGWENTDRQREKLLEILEKSPIQI